MNRFSLILLVLVPAAAVFYLLFQDHAFMEPVKSFVMNTGPGLIIAVVLAIIIAPVIGGIIRSASGEVGGLLRAAGDLVKNGVKGWATVKRVYRTEKTLGGNTLYFLDLYIEDEAGGRYPVTILYPVRGEELGFFVPGSTLPVRSSSSYRHMIFFPQLDYRKMGSILFFTEKDEEWQEALETKEEITLTTIGPSGL